VLSLVGVVTNVTSAITGAVVSVVVVVSSVVVVVSSELLFLAQEMKMRLKKVYENYVYYLIHLSPLPVMRGNKLEKSHIHILKSETLSRESRVTESRFSIQSLITANYRPIFTM